jgi:hypothetical protein
MVSMTEQSFPSLTVIIGRHIRRQDVHLVPVGVRTSGVKRLVMRTAGIGGVAEVGVVRMAFAIPIEVRATGGHTDISDASLPRGARCLFVKRTQRP